MRPPFHTALYAGAVFASIVSTLPRAANAATAPSSTVARRVSLKHSSPFDCTKGTWQGHEDGKNFRAECTTVGGDYFTVTLDAFGHVPSGRPYAIISPDLLIRAANYSFPDGTVAVKGSKLDRKGREHLMLTLTPRDAGQVRHDHLLGEALREAQRTTARLKAEHSLNAPTPIFVLELKPSVPVSTGVAIVKLNVPKPNVPPPVVTPLEHGVPPDAAPAIVTAGPEDRHVYESNPTPLPVPTPPKMASHNPPAPQAAVPFKHVLANAARQPRHPKAHSFWKGAALEVVKWVTVLGVGVVLGYGLSKARDGRKEKAKKLAVYAEQDRATGGTALDKLVHPRTSGAPGGFAAIGMVAASEEVESPSTPARTPAADDVTALDAPHGAPTELVRPAEELAPQVHGLQHEATAAARIEALEPIFTGSMPVRFSDIRPFLHRLAEQLTAKEMGPPKRILSAILRNYAASLDDRRAANTLADASDVQLRGKTLGEAPTGPG